MAADSKDPTITNIIIDAQKVEQIVFNALKEIFPQISNASKDDIMLSYVIIMKSTLTRMNLSEVEKKEAKALFDRMWPDVLVDRIEFFNQPNTTVH